MQLRTNLHAKQGLESFTGRCLLKIWCLEIYCSWNSSWHENHRVFRICVWKDHRWKRMEKERKRGLTIRRGQPERLHVALDAAWLWLQIAPLLRAEANSSHWREPSVSSWAYGRGYSRICLQWCHSNWAERRGKGPKKSPNWGRMVEKGARFHITTLGPSLASITILLVYK